MFPDHPGPKVMREFSPLLAIPVTTADVLSHQSKKEIAADCGAECRPNFLRRLYQKTLVKTQDTNRWLINSGSWSHRGHLVGWFNSPYANLSAVQHLLWATSHMKDAILIPSVPKGCNSHILRTNYMTKKMMHVPLHFIIPMCWLDQGKYGIHTLLP